MTLELSMQVMDDVSRRAAHLVGACGAGMKALTEVLLDSHWSLSGSDLSPPNQAVQKLIDRGLVFHQGHRAANVPDSAEHLVYSSAIPADNPERLEANRRHLPQFSYSQMVARMMRDSIGVCIAGTHGKSTTTAMTAQILYSANRLTAAVVGAELCEDGRSGRSGSGDLFVVESCEFQHSFLDFQPKFAAILCVEHDHFDCYPNFESLETAFRNFAGRTASDGVLLVNNDCGVSRRISTGASTRAKRISFGFDNTADWTAKNCEQTINGMRFFLSHRGMNVADIDLRIRGMHNVCNALAAAALCAEIGIQPEIIRESLASFRGIRRRCEFVGEWNGATFVDDYAHHPTAVTATLKTLRNVVGKRRILCLFQPHQILRTRSLMHEFAASFFETDEAWIAPVFAARESAVDEPGLVSLELANCISSNGVTARSFTSLDQIAITLEDAVRPGDVIVTMGAGDIDRIYHEFTRRIQ